MTIIDLFLDITFNLASIYIAIAIGIIWRFSRLYNEKIGSYFTDIVIWVFFPITIITAVLGLGLDSFDPNFLVGGAIFAVALHLGSYLVSIIFNNQNDPKLLGAKSMSATFPNFVFYPFPIISVIIGSEGILYATVFMVLTLIIRNTLGVYIGLKYGVNTNYDTQNQHTTYQRMKKIILTTSWEMIKFPPFLALIVGFILLVLFGPQNISPTGGELFALIDIMKDISMLMALILIGLSFQSIEQLKLNKLFSRNTIEVGIVRFGISPIIVALVFLIWHFPSVAAAALTIQALSPPAVSNIIYGKYFNLAVDEVATYITSLTLFSLFLLPFEVMILQIVFLS